MTSRQAALLRDLERYIPADATEAGHYADIVSLLTHGGDVFSRVSFEPGHMTAGVFIVDPDGERLLLHHHRRLGRWLQMGGHFDGSEDARAAALREGMEESGLDDLELLDDGIFDVDVHQIPAAKGEPDHRHFDVRFVARSRRPEAIKIDPKESNDLSWIPLDRAAVMMNEEASARSIRKIEGLLHGRSLT